MSYSVELITQIENLWISNNFKKQIEIIKPILENPKLDIELKYEFELLCYYCEALIDVDEIEKALKLINTMKLRIDENELTIELILYKYIEIYYLYNKYFKFPDIFDNYYKEFLNFKQKIPMTLAKKDEFHINWYIRYIVRIIPYMTRINDFETILNLEGELNEFSKLDRIKYSLAGLVIFLHCQGIKLYNLKLEEFTTCSQILQLNNTKFPSSTILYHFNLAWGSYVTGQHELALDHFQRLTQFCRDNNEFLDSLPVYLSQMIWVKLSMGLIDDAVTDLEDFNSYINHKIITENDYNKGKLYLSQSIIYYRKGNLKESLDLSLKCFDIFSENPNDNYSLLDTCLLIIDIYLESRDYSDEVFEKYFDTLLDKIPHLNNYQCYIVYTELIIRYLKINEINKAKDIFSKFRTLHETMKPTTSFLRDHFNLTRALLLNSSDRLSENFEAMSIFKYLSHEEPSRIDIRTYAIISYIEMLIFEFKMKKNNESLSEIHELIKILTKLCQKNLSPILIDVYILKIKMNLLSEKIIPDEILDLFSDAETFAKEYNYEFQLQRLLLEKDQLLNDLRSQRLTQEKYDLRKRLDIVRMEDYVSYIKKSISLHKSS